MYQKFIKRCLDIIISILSLPLLFVVLLPVFILIKLDDNGPLFFNSYRLGKDMKKFKMYKIRTMKVNAPDIRNSDGTTYNSTNDTRVTKVGAFLRKTSIDELPQLINVLFGQMSLVGPRPSPLGDKSIYPAEFFEKFVAKPGITGYSQAKVRNNASIEKRIELDKFYVNNISLSLDMKIVFWTIKSVLMSKNINRN